MGLYLKVREEDEELADDDNSKKGASVVHEVVNKRWEVCVTTSMKGFQQASFVNSIATTKVIIIATSMCNDYDVCVIHTNNNMHCNYCYNAFFHVFGDDYLSYFSYSTQHFMGHIGWQFCVL